MTERFVKHATFVVERIYVASPTKVYQAWADPTAKSKWFSKPEIFEFRVGGREYSRGGPPGGPVFQSLLSTSATKRLCRISALFIVTP